MSASPCVGWVRSVHPPVSQATAERRALDRIKPSHERSARDFLASLSRMSATVGGALNTASGHQRGGRGSFGDERNEQGSLTCASSSASLIVVMHAAEHGQTDNRVFKTGWRGIFLTAIPEIPKEPKFSAPFFCHFAVHANQKNDPCGRI